jgi:hypothetical protein
MGDTSRLFSKGNTGPNLAKPQTYSGADVSVVFNIPLLSPAHLAGAHTLESVQIQTITISSATSVLPVRRCGEARPKIYTRGARTFAGSLVFTMIGQDPFQQIFSVDPGRSSVRGDGTWHSDQMATFDAIILCANEMGGSGIQIIENMSITHWGTTYSIDDLYVESTYSYVAEHVTPFTSNRYGSLAGITADAISELLDDTINRLHQVEKTPDDAAMSADQDHQGGTFKMNNGGQLISFPTFSAAAPAGLEGGTVGMYSSIFPAFEQPNWMDYD